MGWYTIFLFQNWGHKFVVNVFENVLRYDTDVLKGRNVSNAFNVSKMMLDVAPCQTQTTLVKGENVLSVGATLRVRQRGLQREREKKR
jgi:hypothetical protein